jgi:hypothetical protein
VGLQQVQRSEDQIDQEVNTENKSGKPRPAQGQNQMVGIPQVGFLGIKLNKFELPGPDPHMVCSAPHNDQVGGSSDSLLDSARAVEQLPVSVASCQHSKEPSGRRHADAPRPH